MREILNTVLIVRRRSEMGLSQRGLALQLAVSARWVRAVEAADNHQELSLRNVRDLADALGVDPADLLLRPTVDREPEPDDVRVEAALAAAGRLVGREELADLFGWSLRRTVDSLRALDERLSTTGQRLHRLRGDSTIRFRDTVLRDGEVGQLAERRLAKFGLNIRQARLLRDIVAGRSGLTWERRASVPDRMASGALMNQGLIIRVNNRFVASDDVRYSLGLTDKPSAAGTEGRGPTARSRRE